MPNPRVDFAIITALEEERDAILALLPGYQKLATTTEDMRVYYRAKVRATRTDGKKCSYSLIVASSSGMGRVPAANATSGIIRRWRPHFVFLVGIAGGVTEQGVSIGDVIVANQVIDYSMGKVFESRTETRPGFHRVDQRLLEFARHFNADWQTLIRATRPIPGNSIRIIGSVATGDKVVARSSFLRQMGSRLPGSKIVGVEMEAGGVVEAISETSERNRPGFFMVRGVSDLADQDKGSRPVEAWRGYACSVAAAFTVAFLQDGPIPRPADEDPEPPLPHFMNKPRT